MRRRKWQYIGYTCRPMKASIPEWSRGRIVEEVCKGFVIPGGSVSTFHQPTMMAVRHRWCAMHHLKGKGYRNNIYNYL